MGQRQEFAGLRPIESKRQRNSGMVGQIRAPRRKSLRRDCIDDHKSRDRHFRHSSFRKVPTLVLHRTEDTLVSVEGGRELAAGIPGDRLVELPGTDHLFFLDDDANDKVLAEIEEFLTGARSAPAVDRVLATVVFEDIVNSTKRAQATGDQGWRDLLNAHTRRCAASFRGSADER